MNNEAPHFLVYEDDLCKAFLDRRPVQPGMVLVCPKEHVDHVTDLDDEIAAHLIKVCQKIARKIKKELEPKRVGYVVSGYGVPHAHFIVIPTYDSHDITSRHYASFEGREIVFAEKNVPIAQENDQLSIQKKLSLI